MPTNLGNPASAGYKDLSALVHEVRYSNLVEFKTYRNTSAYMWTTPRPFQGSRELGAEIKIAIEPTVNVYDYQRNQTLEVDQADAAYRTIKFNRAVYFNVKVDKLDENSRPVREYMNKLTDNVGKALGVRIDPEVIRVATSSILPHNRGNAAGADGNLMLGTSGTPRAVTGSNVTSFIVDCALTLKNTPAGNEFEPGNMFMLMPSMSQLSFMNSSLASLCCASGRESILLSNENIPNIAGFDIIFYEAQTKQALGGTYTYPVLFGSKDAVAFHMASLENEYNMGSERSFGRYTRGLTIYGVGVIFPKKVGLAICTFAA